MVVQQGEIGIAAVARVVVDAKVDVAGVLGHAVVLAKQLDAGYVHRHHRLGLKLALEQPGVGEGVAGGDGVGAEHRSIFIQRFERVVEGAAAAHRIPIRVFVA